MKRRRIMIFALLVLVAAEKGGCNAYATSADCEDNCEKPATCHDTGRKGADDRFVCVSVRAE